MKLGAKQLRVSEPSEADLKKIKRREVYIICDNVLDTYNIGSIFRLADALAVKCVYLCGGSETPPNARIAKASVGTDKWVPWQYRATAVEAILDLRSRHSGGSETTDRISRDPIASLQDDRIGIKVVAIEQSKNSQDFRKVEYTEPVAFVVGHETGGVSKEALKMADQIVEIPMFGINRSLNVMVSLAIVLYQAVVMD
ncbi:hypothetical protein HYU92_04740 [Candidatus Curtissbacteria bacterium]|nr:hypothetical protein [Candidatus Curtissbacteria bacterium]